MDLAEQHPEIYREYSSLSNLAHIQASTYTPGMTKPIPLTDEGLGYNQSDAQMTSPKSSTHDGEVVPLDKALGIHSEEDLKNFLSSLKKT